MKSVCRSAGNEGSPKSTGDNDGSGKSGEARSDPEWSERGSDSPSDSRNKQSRSLYSDMDSDSQGPFSAALRVEMYFIARRSVVILVSFSLAPGIWVACM